MGSIDLEFIKSNGKEVTTPILLTEVEDYKLEIVKEDGPVNVGDVLFKVTK